MKNLMLIFLLMILIPVSSRAQHPIATADLTFIDPDRDNRQVACDIYYPGDAPGPTGYPVVALGHGYLLGSGLYSWWGQQLAGAGYVAAVPRTGGELFPDHAVFAADLAFVTRALVQAGQEPQSPLFGLTADRRIVAGHSMGGGCSLLAAAGDPGIMGVVNFAAAETNPSAIDVGNQIECPVLLFGGSNDCVSPPGQNQVPMFDALDGSWRTLAILDGASHCQFAAYSFICGLGESCSADITRQEQWDRTWYLLEPWLEAVTGSDSSGGSEFSGRVVEAQPWAAITQAGSLSPAPPSASSPEMVAWPNPFNPATSIHFSLPESAATVSLRVYDVAGRLVKTLHLGALPEGDHQVVWRGDDTEGRTVASGVYYCRLEAAGHVRTRSMVLAR